MSVSCKVRLVQVKCDVFAAVATAFLAQLLMCSALLNWQSDQSPCSVKCTPVYIHLPVSRECKLSYTHLSVAKNGAIVAFQQTLSHLMCTGGIDMVLPSALKDAIKL